MPLAGCIGKGQRLLDIALDLQFRQLMEVHYVGEIRQSESVHLG